jgi:cytochrome c551
MRVRNRNKWALGLAGLALVVSLAACGGNADNGANDPDQGNNGGTNNAGTNNGGTNNAGNGGTVDAAAAEALYKNACIGCHAADLAGGVGPNLQKVGGEMTAEQIHDKIANGGGGMPAFKDQLTDAEIESLTSWLSAKK